MKKYTMRMTRSKYKFPTGTERGAPVGSVNAQKDIERELGYSISDWKPRHTRTLWVWLKPRGQARRDRS